MLSSTLPPPRRQAGRGAALGVSLAVHAVVILAIAALRPPLAEPPAAPAAVAVTLWSPPRPDPPPPVPPMPRETAAPQEPSSAPPAPQPASAPSAPAKRPEPGAPASRTPSRSTQVEAVLAAAPEPAIGPTAGTGGASSSGVGQAMTVADGGGAGEGSGHGTAPGGACDMAKRLEAALRQDADIRAAVLRVAAPAGRALLVWNGEWTPTPGEAGKGLAGVRQAIALEVAFAPPECKGAAMRGLVFVRVAEGSPRIALGRHGDWRWTDLLGANRR